MKKKELENMNWILMRFCTHKRRGTEMDKREYDQIEEVANRLQHEASVK